MESLNDEINIETGQIARAFNEDLEAGTYWVVVVVVVVVVVAVVVVVVVVVVVILDNMLEILVTKVDSNKNTTFGFDGLIVEISDQSFESELDI